MFDWSPCSLFQFADAAWPASGSGATLTWSTDDCPVDRVISSGYFYVGAYDTGTMSIVGFPPTGEIKTADCAGAEVVLDQALDITQVGWVSLDGAAKLGDPNGCNPALEPCNEPPVAVSPVTWGRLKTLGTRDER